MRVTGAALVSLAFVALAAVANAHELPDDAAQPTPVATPAPRALTTRAAQRKAPPSTVIVPTEHGHRHVFLAPIVVGRPDTTDPWTGGPITTSRTYAPLDATDPWSGAILATPRAHAAVDPSDPWP